MDARQAFKDRLIAQGYDEGEAEEAAQAEERAHRDYVDHHRDHPEDPIYN